MMNNRLLILISLPLVDEENNSKGVMTRWLNKYPKYLPRIGESIHVHPGLSPKVLEVKYSGHGLYLIQLRLEPVSSIYRGELEKSGSLKRRWMWKWEQDADSKNH
jgi:hypothetical protein